ncbi:uncharacterized protein LOC133194470 [Saccostrea echinata]|uniref:uncharacterized protein LOC133194470 n=1 Tax=Saccostrea echinata TaxID=191078 RepID=UPI002A7EAADD|nr:uncharacterized protein LOC133194470 [Saccostrea echinata]
MVCEAYCQQCDGPVCIKCILGNHKGRDGVDLSNIVANKKEEIEKDTAEIETVIIPKCQKSENEAKVRASNCIARFEELEQEMEKHRILWHKEVDTIFNKLCSLIKSMRDDNMNALETHQTNLKFLIPDMKKTVEQNKDMLSNDRFSEVINYKSKIIVFRNIHADIHFEIQSLNANTVHGSEHKIKLKEYVASLTQTHSNRTDLFATESFDRVIATIPTKVESLLRVVCLGAEKAWVSGKDTTIKCVDIQGSVQDSVKTTFMERPTDITLTRQGDLIYNDYKNRTLNIVRHGRTEVLITTQEDWKPRGLCSTRSGNILKGKFKLLLSENTNGDICASDPNANIVTVLDKLGRVRFRYDGTPARMKEAFYPSQTVTYSMNQIIVADYNNGCLHILDENGQFLRCVYTCELNSPYGLSVDSEGRLWVGLCYSRAVKVIQYMKEPCKCFVWALDYDHIPP